MSVTEVQSSTFLADAVNLIRDKLQNSIIDPIVEIRPAGQRFVYMSYPQKAVTYPIMTVVDRNIQQPQRLGMGSTATSINLDIEVRIWARNVKERDELFDSVYNYLRGNQFATNGLNDAELFGFTLNSAVNINENGEQGIKSKVMEYRFLFITS